MEFAKFLNTQIGFYIAFSIYVVSLVILGLIISKTPRKKYIGRILIPVGFIELTIIFFLITLGFPKSDQVGPAVVPRLWMGVIVALSLYLLIRGIAGKEGEDPESGRIDTIFLFLGLTILYLLAIQYIGYFVSSVFFVILGMYMLSYRNWKVIISVTIGWILFSYFAFFKLLFVPLPKGLIITRIFG